MELKADHQPQPIIDAIQRLRRKRPDAFSQQGTVNGEYL